MQPNRSPRRRMAAVNDFRVIRLSRPVKHDGGVVWAIRLRRPDGDAWRAIFGVFARAMTRDEQTRGTLSVLSGLPTEVFKKVRPDDFERLAAAVLDLIPEGSSAATARAND